MKAPEASDLKADPTRTIVRFLLLLSLLVGTPCVAQTVQPGDALVKVFPNCEFGPQRVPLGGALGELCKTVWKRIEADNGEVTWIDTRASGDTLPREVWVYTGVPNASINPDALTTLFFDCQGHFENWGGDGPSDWMDAPPRSVAGEIAATVCSQSKLQPAPADTPTQPVPAAKPDAWEFKGTCSQGSIAKSDGVPAGVDGMSGRDFQVLTKRMRAGHLTLGVDGFLWATQPVQCDSALVWINVNSKGHTMVMFQNGGLHNMTLGFLGLPVDRAWDAAFLADGVYLGEGKPGMPISQMPHEDSPLCVVYFTDHGTFTPGWQNRLAGIQCDATAKTATGPIHASMTFHTNQVLPASPLPSNHP
jgi:hypothetical protein